MLVGTDDKYSVRILVKENVLDRMHFGFGRNNLHFLPRRHACFLKTGLIGLVLCLGWLLDPLSISQISVLQQP